MVAVQYHWTLDTGLILLVFGSSFRLTQIQHRLIQYLILDGYSSNKVYCIGPISFTKGASNRRRLCYAVRCALGFTGQHNVLVQPCTSIIWVGIPWHFHYCSPIYMCIGEQSIVYPSPWILPCVQVVRKQQKSLNSKDKAENYRPVDSSQ